MFLRIFLGVPLNILLSLLQILTPVYPFNCYHYFYLVNKSVGSVVTLLNFILLCILIITAHYPLLSLLPPPSPPGLFLPILVSTHIDMHTRMHTHTNFQMHSTREDKRHPLTFSVVARILSIKGFFLWT